MCLSTICIVYVYDTHCSREQRKGPLLHPPPFLCLHSCAQTLCLFAPLYRGRGASVWRTEASNLCLPNNAAADMTGDITADITRKRFYNMQIPESGKVFSFSFLLRMLGCTLTSASRTRCECSCVTPSVIFPPLFLRERE